jgi:hypothetical protein
MQARTGDLSRKLDPVYDENMTQTFYSHPSSSVPPPPLTNPLASKRGFPLVLLRPPSSVFTAYH